MGFIWLASGLYRVLPDEQGVVLRFGKFIKTTQPGLNYHIPFPVETVETPKVTKVNRMDIGFRSERDSGFSQGGGVADVPQESLMLTGDENIVNIDFSVFWVIKDAGKFLFEIQDPEGTVKAAAETAMREVIAKSDIQPILTEGRAKIEVETQEIIQSILDEYNSGIQVTQVQTQKADPPDQVIDAFRDVQAARADMERSKNEAEAYANDVIPRARGEAQKILQAAEAYKKQVVAKAEGEASRFVSIFNEYDKAKEVTVEWVSKKGNVSFYSYKLPYKIRKERNSLLAETDWMASSDITISDAWKTYRQSLRDITSGVDTVEKAENVTWPTKPS